MYYWTHAVKSTHVMLFENIADWHVIVDCNNFFQLDVKSGSIDNRLTLAALLLLVSPSLLR